MEKDDEICPSGYISDCSPREDAGNDMFWLVQRLKSIINWLFGEDNKPRNILHNQKAMQIILAYTFVAAVMLSTLIMFYALVPFIIFEAVLASVYVSILVMRWRVRHTM